MEYEKTNNTKIKISFKYYILISIIILCLTKENNTNKTNELGNDLLLDFIPNEITLPRSAVAMKNLNYCPYYTPKDKEFEKVPLKYKHGVSIVITAYQADKYIKETLDSVKDQSWIKKNKNYEIIIGIDGCNITLITLQNIMQNYQNIRVFMMAKNSGTYITTNTMMTIAKYDNLIRFDADDIMHKNFLEVLMNISETEDVDEIMFRQQNFGKNKIKKWAYGQFLVKHWVFDWFGGFLPWICDGDGEFHTRIEKFINVKKIHTILMKRRIHDSNLTTSPIIGHGTKIRVLHADYIKNISRKIININEAVIIKVVEDYIEIFPKP